ncbi:MAG: hypothetical protein CYG59_17720, partial [Chloroflexi bacterium]
MAAEDYAVVIGISRYPSLRDLEGSVKDAMDFIEWLKGPAKVPTENIKDVLSKSDPDPGDTPILQQIDEAFLEVMNAGRARPVRRLYVYFAGHGCAQEVRHVALLMANANLDLLNRSIDTLSYHDGLARSAVFPEQIIFYDCCRNWEQRVKGREPEWTPKEPGPGVADVVQFVLYAAGFTQYANERPISPEYSTRRGLFTRALLDGLNGGAAVRQGGEWVVTTRRLVPYLVSRLKYLTRAEGVRQELSWNPAGPARDLVLAPVDTPTLQAVSVGITTLPAPSELIIEDDRAREI